MSAMAGPGRLPVDEVAFVRLTLRTLRRLHRQYRLLCPRPHAVTAELWRAIRREQQALACVRRRRRERGVSE